MTRRCRRWGVGLLSAAVLLGRGVPAGAEAVGSPAGILKKGKWIMALASSFAPERGMNGVGEATVYQGGHSRGYGLTDWLSVYGKIGGASIEVDDSTIRKTTETSTTNSFGGNVLASVQLKGRLLELKRPGVEWDGSFQYLDMRARHKGDNEGRWHEWLFATSIAKSMGRVKPYLGGKLSLVHFTFKVRENSQLIAQGTYEQDHPFGFFVGTDVYLGQRENVVLNIESAFVDGPEVAASIAYIF